MVYSPAVSLTASQTPANPSARQNASRKCAPLASRSARNLNLDECASTSARRTSQSVEERHRGRIPVELRVENRPANGQIRIMRSAFSGPVYVVRDNIDTDQIIPAQFLNLIPTIADEYEKLGGYALEGLPDSLYPVRFVKLGQLDSEYAIVVAGRNFGCGSSREHAPIALGSANCKVVVAESFARIFFRNCVATGELYPCECVDRLCEVLKTGEAVTVDLDAASVKVEATGKVYSLKPLGDVRAVVDAGGLFNYARQNGMIPARA